MLWDEPKIFFLERRYFFSIILSEFLKNRVALHFDWLYDNPQYMTCDEKGHAVCAYDAMAFLAYINQVILRSSNEKAYVIPATQTVCGKLYRLEF